MSARTKWLLLILLAGVGYGAAYGLVFWGMDAVWPRGHTDVNVAVAVAYFIAYLTGRWHERRSLSCPHGVAVSASPCRGEGPGSTPGGGVDA